MPNLSTTYMGLFLRNPLVVSSSGFTNSMDTILQLENAGADAIEINVFIVPTNRKISSADIEFKYRDILTEVCRMIKIPVAMRIGCNFTNLVGMIDKLSANGASAVVMLNRFYEPDINLEMIELTSSSIYSSPNDFRNSLRWIGIVSGKVQNID